MTARQTPRRATLLRRIRVPLADLLATPDGARHRQLLLGEAVTVHHEENGWCRVSALRDGYCGYLPQSALALLPEPTCRVTARATHLYPAPDFKRREILSLSHGSLLCVTGRTGCFAETPQGFAPAVHLSPIDDIAPDPVAVAELFLGTPYLWGGNSSFGIDCSGLVQMACLASGIACPGDSNKQAAELGEPLPPDAPLRRGDLLFWAGHVAWVSGPDQLLHANACHMAVVHEPLSAAIARIEAQGNGPVTARKRLKGSR